MLILIFIVSVLSYWKSESEDSNIAAKQVSILKGQVTMSALSEASTSNSFADKWKFVGIAVEEQGYTIWGTSPIFGDDGKVHLFVARWPCKFNVDPGWRTHSEIAHYVGDSPEGPFAFSDLALEGAISGKQEAVNDLKEGSLPWDSFAPHNPAIHKVDGQYVLLYIANNGIEAHPSNQKIGMATATSPYGPWTKVADDGLILSPPENDQYWNYKASNGVNNPAFLPHPSGGYFLYFKSEKARMGLAIAENLEGPYVPLPFPVTSNNRSIEDGYSFIYGDKFALITTDNHGMIEEGGGILWTSEDGIHFDTFEKGFHHINTYHEFNMTNAKVHYGPRSRSYAKFERPQLLILDGEILYMYAPSGTNIYGGDCTVSYVMKYEND